MVTTSRTEPSRLPNERSEARFRCRSASSEKLRTRARSTTKDTRSGAAAAGPACRASPAMKAVVAQEVAMGAAVPT
jgi:hypothetical protein